MKENTWRKEYSGRICKECGNVFFRDKMERAENFKKKVVCSPECFGKNANKRLCEAFKKKFDLKECRVCRQMFQPVNQVHAYCGSKIKKEGCSWKHYKDKVKKLASTYRLWGKSRLWRNTTKSFVR